MEALRKETALEKARKARGKQSRMKLSRAQAMTLFCLECVGYDGHRGDSTRSVKRREASHEITQCTDTECPLYEWRNKRVILPPEKA